MKAHPRFASPFSLLILVLIGACAGPERTPHQPIKGVDTPDNRVDNPHDRREDPPRRDPAPPSEPPASAAPAPAPGPGAERQPAREQPQSRDDLLADFVAKVTAAWRAQPGIVAVFPALTKDGETGNVHVNGLGEWLASETSHALEMEGVRGVLAGHGLVNDLKAANRGLDAWRGLDDVYWLGDRVGAAYVCFGAVNQRVFHRQDRDEVLEIDWQCRRLGDRSPVATVRQRLTGGALSQQLGKHFRSDSEWKIGAEAGPAAEPSADAEVRIAARMLATQVARKHEAALKNKRARVAPTSIRSLAGKRANLQAWSAEFDRQFDDAEQKASAAGNTDAARAALASGPVRIQGKEYATLGAAVDAFRGMSGELGATPAGQLATDLGRMVGERLREVTGETLQVLPDDGERDQLLGLIQREARAHQQSDAVDPQTIAALRAKGAEVLVESTLRPFLKSYQLRIVLHDLTTGRQLSEAIDLDEQFRKQLDAILAQ